MIHVKSSLAPEGKPVAFELNKDNGFRYIGEYDVDPNELLSGSSGKKKAKLAEELLLCELRESANTQKEILAKAEKCGISKRTVDAAKKALGVQSEKLPDGWYWSLPDAKDARLQDCKDTENLQPYDKKVRQDRPLTWVNDAELNKISALNAALNKGETLDSMRRRFTELTKRKIFFSDLPAIFFSVKYRIFPLIFSQTMRNIVSRQQTNGTTATGQPFRFRLPHANLRKKRRGLP